ncbi:MAG: peptide chain release factor N(5)-glutamine methyltransferase [Spirochaetota bacterium]
MTVRDAVIEATDRLRAAGVQTPYLDATVLLSFCMGVTKEHLFAEFLTPIGETTLSNYRDTLEKRAAGVPVSYIRRQKEFYGRDFYVDERSLVPRPETETLVEVALEIIDEHGSGRVLDCCSGSGCIAVTLKAERPEPDIVASELSEDAREVFRLNSRRILGRELECITSDLLQDVEGGFDLIVSNPPYLRSEEVAQMRESGRPEPPEALDGGKDGLELIRRLIREALYSLNPYGYLVIELDDDQNGCVRRLMEDHGYRKVGAREDLAGRRRVVFGRRA